jgi:spermidine/putrescine transport system ATP-binding protein
MAGGQVEIKNLSKTFGDVVAVDDVSFGMPSGEFFSMLGPSGCGKTTTLRMIAGFEAPDSGRIVLDGVDMQHTPAHKRPVNTVFQSYMIFPHLNVYDNVAFGLRRQHCSKPEVKRRVGEALDLVQLGNLAARKQSQLSGGQQQRVALARALVLSPAVLLLDEPLGALDAKLRRQLQIELKTLQQQVGITFVYVTHDQEEALTMSDRIAVMNNGRVEQVASPREVYEEPATEFVADFLGVSNLIYAEVEGHEHDACRLRVGDFILYARAGDRDASGKVKCVVRPERIRLEPYESSGENHVPGIVERLVYLGSSTKVIVHLATGQTLQSVSQNDGVAQIYSQGTPVQVHLPGDALRILRSGAAESTGPEPTSPEPGPAPAARPASAGDPLPDSASMCSLVPRTAIAGSAE